MNCYWCGKYFYDITSQHFVMHERQWTCPEHVGDKEKHLTPYVRLPGEIAVDQAFERKDK